MCRDRDTGSAWFAQLLASVLAAATLKVSLTSSGRSALKRRRSLKLKLRVTVTPPSGAAKVLTGTVTLKR